jgi:pSer/pThr/pTyr-binding forkhead associated (FHA) protein
MALVRCPDCGVENDATFAYCPACGRPLRSDRRCGGCGAWLDPSHRFCGRCGRPAEIAAAEPPPLPRRGRATPLPADDLPAPARPGPTAGARAAGLRLVAVRHDGQPGAIAPLGAGPIVCGRARGQVLFPDDATVSPEHARFTVRGASALVEDLGSINGTFLRLQAPRPISSGDEIRVGRQLLRLEAVARPPVESNARPWGSPDPGYRARLVQLLEGGGGGEVFPLRLGENTVGREVGDVTFPNDRYVSARHARLDVSERGVVVADLGSSNGTFVRIAAPTAVAPGDQLLVGMQLVRVEG